MRARSLLVLCFLVAFAFGKISLASQSQSSDETKLQADAAAAYEARDWAKSAKLYEEMVAAHPENARWLYRLATSEQGLGEYDKALSNFQKSTDEGLPPIFGEYAVATIYAQKGDKENAFAHLDKAIANGYNQPDVLSSDERLASVRTDARFAHIVQMANHNLKPCADTPENRQFDFWVGEWNVETTQNPAGVGQSKIELILGDCVVQENWTGNGGSTGKSYNIYNAALKRWEQYWVDNSGGNIFFYGGLKDGVMDYWTDEIPQPNGTKLKRHLQFIKNGSDQVRQFSQGSTDGGKTWSVEYDFTYNRKK